MRLSNMLIMGIVSMTMIGTVNASVYGTLKLEIETNRIEEDVVTVLHKGEVVKIVERQNDTYIIAVDNHIEQEVNIEDIDLLGKLAYTMAPDTKMRDKASPTADIINYLPEGEVVLVIARQDNFYLVKFKEQEGYIYKSQIDETGLEILPYAQTNYAEAPAALEQVQSESTYIGEQVVAYAKQFLGGKYVYGGNSLTNGVDCSGFAQQIMKHFGVQIQRSSRTQFASNGTAVSESELLPGDLVFYGNGGSINHVAIYAGDGQIIHASDAKSGIKMSPLHYGKPLIGMKRVLN